MYYKRNINQFTIAEFQLKLSYETSDSIFTKNDVNEIYNSFLNTFLRHYHSCFPVIKTNKLSYASRGLQLAYEHHVNIKEKFTRNVRSIKIRLKTSILNITVGSCQGLEKQKKEKMEYDRRILNSTNGMRTSWNVINIERGTDMNNRIIQSINVDGKTTAHHQTIADTFNKHFITILDVINP